MWTKTYSKTFKDIKKEDIWRIWVDVNNWTTWHGDLDYCKMEEATDEAEVLVNVAGGLHG